MVSVRMYFMDTEHLQMQNTDKLIFFSVTVVLGGEKGVVVQS